MPRREHRTVSGAGFRADRSAAGRTHQPRRRRRILRRPGRNRNARGPPIPPPPRRGRTPSTFAEAGTGRRRRRIVIRRRARDEEQPPITVLKSGVVDGMAYSLYSDGSIEAQMPEGMMRFASIDELRSHLDQRP